MTPHTASLEKAFALLGAIAEAGRNEPLSVLAERAGLPLSTAHRLAATLTKLGLVLRERKGRYSLGPAVIGLAQGLNLKDMMARASRPVLRQLARDFRKTIHMAVFEGDMVTYVAKESGGGNGVWTIEGAQLEAYCSGLGKVLLAHLPPEDCDRYLAEGPFVALTARTITDPEKLREELERVRQRGYALDDGEVTEVLKCVAVPIREGNGRVFAAISMSGEAADYDNAFIGRARTALERCAAQIRERLYP